MIKKILSSFFEKYSCIIEKPKKGYKYVPHKDLIQPYHPSHDQDYQCFIDLVDVVQNQGRTFLSVPKLYVLWQAVRNTRNIDGGSIELGTYRGGSAYFIASSLRFFNKKNKELMLFDTFSGHPDCLSEENDRLDIHYKGKFSETSFSSVEKYLSCFDSIKFVKGDCVQSVGQINIDKISFVHIDLDLYIPIIKSLEVLDSKIVSGGVIVIDDFLAETCPGVEKAIFEFLNKNQSYSMWFSHTRQLSLVKE